MENISTILLAVVLFLIITLLWWKLTNRYVKKIHGKKMFNQWGTRMFYWTGSIMVSGLLTVFVLKLF
ncbi:hypothetical protein [Hyunsoonleella pacifica]|uniref:Uncharacterized protein n=1 Tax=Hyunsoonleella pacifica TaxID=1080224 RepID=A0A4Q9FQW2_9FLAO|nr:hypothetical protein [Hyunsoonleella pacifica]TBN16641.1 hypothetical protein EYD46_08380 [Hyunsoonleella pacifica]